MESFEHFILLTFEHKRLGSLLLLCAPKALADSLFLLSRLCTQELAQKTNVLATKDDNKVFHWLREAVFVSSANSATSWNVVVPLAIGRKTMPLAKL